MPVVDVGLTEDEGDDGLALLAVKTVGIGLAEEGDSAGPLLAQLGSTPCCTIGEPKTPIF